MAGRERGVHTTDMKFHTILRGLLSISDDKKCAMVQGPGTVHFLGEDRGVGVRLLVITLNKSLNSAQDTVLHLSKNINCQNLP